MLLPNIDRPIVLVGMMAAGKTRLGRELAMVLDLEFIDTDKCIEDETGQTIARIFEISGESAFREMEATKIRDMLDGALKPLVLSTGGGAILRPESAELIFGNTYSIWMRASLATILRRTAKRTDRPLLKNPDPAKTLQEMADMRYPIYARADIAVDTDSGDVEGITADIIRQLNLLRDRNS